MNTKEAITTYPVADLIRARWSPRSFGTGLISREEMDTLLEAASWSFSSGNVQPWKYIYAHRGSDGFAQILSCLNEENQLWARNAAILVLSMARRERRPGVPNRWCIHDVGASVMVMILQAVSMNIYSHPMGGFDSGLIMEKLGEDPSVFEPVACIAMGYLGEVEALDEQFRARELEARTRKSISEISRQLL
jgi:nitroreductase